MGDKDLVKIYLGKQTPDQLTNIVREIKDILRPFEGVRPIAIMKMTRDPREQYSIHLNQRALTYIITHLQNVPPAVPFLSAGDQSMKPMPKDFGLKTDSESELDLRDFPI